MERREEWKTNQLEDEGSGMLNLVINGFTNLLLKVTNGEWNGVMNYESNGTMNELTDRIHYNNGRTGVIDWDLWALKIEEMS